jgi:hypothetical protein
MPVDTRRNLHIWLARTFNVTAYFLLAFYELISELINSVDFEFPGARSMVVKSRPLWSTTLRSRMAKKRSIMRWIHVRIRTEK